MAERPTSVTLLLERWRDGDASAFDRLLPLVYGELRLLAARQLRGEREGHTLQPTALVHEAYMRLVDTQVPWADRAHFLAVAARSMRRVLVDHARARRAAKRGGGAPHETLTPQLAGDLGPDLDLVALDTALAQLAEQDPRAVQAVELHYFAGLSYEEAARVLEISPATFHRDLRLARAWLHAHLEDSEDPEDSDVRP